MLRWSSVAVLAAGPETDLTEAGRALNGAGAALSEASAVVEDGRMHVSASGLCLMEAEEDKPAVVFTCAAVVAPFLAKRAAPAARRRERSRLRAAVDLNLVPTTEFFVIFSESSSSSKGVLGSYAATLVACVPMPSAEDSFKCLQSACPQDPPEAVGRDTRHGEALSWQRPAVGGLGLAVLHVRSAPSTGAPLSAASAKRIAAACTVGRMIRLQVSPFGTLKPSLFLNTESRGLLSGGSADASVGLLLLDARCLPGSEGGVVVSDEEDAEQVPLALVTPPLRSDNVTMGTAVPLSTAAAALANSLPGHLLCKMLGREALRVLRAAAQGSHSSAPIEATFAAALCEDLPDNGPRAPEDFPPTLRCSLCSISVGNFASSAVALSTHGHILIRSELLRSNELQPHSSFRCLISRSLQHANGEADTFVVSRDASVLHIFECFSNLALIQLRHTDGNDSDSVLPAPLLPLEVSSMSFLEHAEEGAEVWSLQLSSSTVGHHHDSLLSGSIARVVTGRARWNPVLLESSHLHRPMDSSLLLRAGSAFSLLGFALPGSQSEVFPAILPHRVLSIALPQLEPLQTIIRTLAIQPRGLELLAHADKTWRAFASLGVAQMIFRIEASNTANMAEFTAEVGGRKLPHPTRTGSGSQLRSAL